MMISRTLTPIVAAALLLSACYNQGPKSTLGAAGGAAAGGLIASQVGGGAGAIAAGVILGGLLGGAIGNQLDNADRQYMNQNTQNTLEYGNTGQVAVWQNPDSGHGGTITPVKTYQTESGTYCREFQQTVNIGGQIEQAYGTACRQPDGSWKIVN